MSDQSFTTFIKGIYYDNNSQQWGSKIYSYMVDKKYNLQKGDIIRRKQNNALFQIEEAVPDCTILSCKLMEDIIDVYHSVPISYVYANYNGDKETKFKKDKKGSNIMDMKKMLGDVRFGKNYGVKISMYGLAYYNEEIDTYKAWDANTRQLIDVADFVFDIEAYQFPAAIKDIVEGDMVIVNNRYYTVLSNSEGSLTGVDMNTGTIETLAIQNNIFNMQFVTKIFNPFGSMLNGTPDENTNNPFNNMNPMMLMMMLDKDGDNDNFMQMFLMSQMMNQQNGNANNMNPFMLMAMMK